MLDQPVFCENSRRLFCRLLFHEQAAKKACTYQEHSGAVQYQRYWLPTRPARIFKIDQSGYHAYDPPYVDGVMHVLTIEQICAKKCTEHTHPSGRGLYSLQTGYRPLPFLCLHKQVCRKDWSFSQHNKIKQGK